MVYQYNITDLGHNFNTSRDILQTNLRFYRKQRGISQHKLSTRTNLQRSYLAELESGKRNPTISKIYQVAIGFCMEPWHLLKPITYNEWMHEKEFAFTPYDLTITPSKLLSSDGYLNVLVEHIKYLRKKQNWMQRDLAQRAGLSEIFIRCIELREKEPTLNSLDKLSSALGLEVWQLIKGLDMNTIWLENDMWL